MKKSTPLADVDRSPLPAHQQPWEREPDPCWSCGGDAEARDDIHVRCIDTKNIDCEVMNHWYTRKTWNTRASDTSKEYVRGQIKGLEDAAKVAQIEKRNGLANLKDAEDKDYDEGYSEAAQLIVTNIQSLISQHSPEVTNNESSECQIAKVIPVGHSYSVAIGSLGIKLFESLADAQEVRDAINKAIAAAVSQGGGAGSVQHDPDSAAVAAKEIQRLFGPPSGSSAERDAKRIEAIITKHLGDLQSQLADSVANERKLAMRIVLNETATPTSPDTDEIAAIRERWPLPPLCPIDQLPMQYADGAPEAHVPPHWYCTDHKQMTPATSAEFVSYAQSEKDVHALFAAYDALKGELSRLKTVPADEVKEQDNNESVFRLST